jgi:hypothetical protein
MPTFVLTYRHPNGYTSTPESAAAWMSWFEEMGDQLVELGKPVLARTSVGNCSADATELGGFSLIQADDMESAVVLAKGCPDLGRGGGVEVGQLGEVPPRPAAHAGA